MVTSSTAFFTGPAFGLFYLAKEDAKFKNSLPNGFAVAILVSIIIGLFFTDTIVGKKIQVMMNINVLIEV